MTRSAAALCTLVAAALALVSGPARRAMAQDRPALQPRAWVPNLDVLRGEEPSALRDVVERFSTDRGALNRRYVVQASPVRRRVFRGFYDEWLARLRTLPFDRLGLEGQIDYVLLRNELERGLAELAREERRWTELGPVLPFADTIFALEERRRAFEPVDPAGAARTLTALSESVDGARRALETATADASNGSGISRIIAYRAAQIIADVRRTLERWFGFSDGYDPLFSWWARAPYQRADSALADYAQQLRRRVVGIRPGAEEPIVGLPIGRDAILEDLRFEMIPYSPEELIAIAEREFAWCEREMQRAAREMGYGDDWRAALEHVKNDYAPPGEQTVVVRDLAREAEAFLDAHDLVTVPPLARNVWRMEMMSPERQRVSPFFLGGEVILVSFPTDAMTEGEKLMSMRGNNIHFSRATVFHELIPGHHLQGFMSSRFQSHRRVFATPFWSEGNALYWELLLWDLGFQDTPEDRVGALFWRSHRAARIIFSLSFHLGTMTPEEAIDFLVERVGHERANAEGEVRRSFNGSYSPLYQVAYMMGGLQFRALRAELVGTGTMTDREYHDAILHGGTMPVEMVRARLTGQRLTRDFRTSWRFDPGR